MLENLQDISQALASVGARLEAAADESGKTPRGESEQAEQLDVLLREVAEVRDVFANIERALAEYAMHRRGYTQRTAASALHISVTTASRWSQRPIYFERPEEDSSRWRTSAQSE